MELHDDPQALVETFVSQHAVVLGEVHGDIAARFPEVPDRFIDQGNDPRPITVSCTLLETLLFSRWRRQTSESTLKAAKGNGFGIVLLDGKGTRIRCASIRASGMAVCSNRCRMCLAGRS